MAMLDPARFLIACPRCATWPMAANVKRSTWAAMPREVSFVCGRCGSREAAIVSASGHLTSITPRRQEMRSEPAMPNGPAKLR